jgi:large subunit ribosomal protein L25
MADAGKIQVEARDPQKNKGTGSRVSRKLRKQGKIPAIIYGHKQAPVPVAVPRDSVWEMIKRSTHLAELSMDSGTETVLVRDVQWDHLGKEIIHLDFSRVSADETIETEVRLEIRGSAAGVLEGGTLEVLVHELKVKCRANAIPDSIRVEVGHLKLDEAIHAKDIAVPEGVTIDGDPEMLVMHVVSRAPTVETAPGAEGETQSQPEVIKPERKEKED